MCEAGEGLAGFSRSPAGGVVAPEAVGGIVRQGHSGAALAAGGGEGSEAGGRRAAVASGSARYRCCRRGERFHVVWCMI